MSYIKNRIAKNLEEDATYRTAYEEEVELLAQAKARRQAMMKRFTVARKAHHLSQEQLAEKLSISQERVSQIESGAETISVDRLLDLTAALGLHLVIADDDDVRQRQLETMVVS